MMNETNIKKMEELLTNEEFAQKIADAGSNEKAYQLFADNGVDASYEDFLAYIEKGREIMIEKGLMTKDGELSEEMLDAVSGGGKGGALLCFIFAGIAIAAGQGGPAVMLIIAGMALWKYT